MAKPHTLFDPGKILLWAEEGLVKLSLLMEGRVDRYLTKKHQKDSRREAVQKQLQHYREIAKEQPYHLDSRSAEEIQQRTQELDQLQNLEAQSELEQSEN